MAVPVAQAKGVYASGTTSFVADVPAGIQANDILLIIMESTDSTTAAGTPNTPTDWTKLFEETQGAGATGVTTLTIFGKVATGSETDVTVNGVLNHCSGNMFAIRGAKPSLSAADLKVGTGAGAASGNMTGVPGITVDEADCLGLLVCASTRDANNSSNFSAWASANGTGETEWEDNHVSTGAGGGIGVAWFNAPASGSTGDGSATIGVSVHWRAVQLIFEPSAAVNHALAFDMPLVLTVDSAAARTTFAAFVMPLGLDVAMAATRQTFAAFETPLGLSVETAMGRETFGAFVMPLGLQIDTNLVTAVEHFIAFDMPLGLSVDTALMRETFAAFAEAIGLDIGTALTRETFVAFVEALGLSIQTALDRETFAMFAESIGLTMNTALGRETFAAFDDPFALDIMTNLGHLQPTASASRVHGPRFDLDWI